MIKKRELAAVVMLVVAIAGVVVYFIIYLAKQTIFAPPKPLEYIIQCATLQAKGSQSRLFQTKVHENIIRCHALLWKIPPAYYAEKDAIGSAPESMVTNEIIIRGSFTSDGKLMPFDKNKKTDAPVYSNITIKPSWASFKIMSHDNWFDSVKKVWDVKKIASNINGVEIFDSIESRHKDTRARAVFFTQDAAIIQLETWEFIAECYARNNSLDDIKNSYKTRELSKDSLCQVTSKIDERVFAKFNIRYSQVAQIENIVNSVSTTLKQFMLN